MKMYFKILLVSCVFLFTGCSNDILSDIEELQTRAAENVLLGKVQFKGNYLDATVKLNSDIEVVYGDGTSKIFNATQQYYIPIRYTYNTEGTYEIEFRGATNAIDGITIEGGVMDFNLNGCPGITRISLNYNPLLLSLDLSPYPSLTHLDCYRNYDLSSVDFSVCPYLVSLNCHDIPITDLDLSQNLELRYLTCGGNDITSLDLSRNTKLQIMYCHNLFKEEYFSDYYTWYYAWINWAYSVPVCRYPSTGTVATTMWDDELIYSILRNKGWNVTS